MKNCEKKGYGEKKSGDAGTFKSVGFDFPWRYLNPDLRLASGKIFHRFKAHLSSYWRPLFCQVRLRPHILDSSGDPIKRFLRKKTLLFFWHDDPRNKIGNNAKTHTD